MSGGDLSPSSANGTLPSVPPPRPGEHPSKGSSLNNRVSGPLRRPPLDTDDGAPKGLFVRKNDLFRKLLRKRSSDP